MGYYARLSPEFGDVTELDAAQLAPAGLPGPDAPRSGYVMRNGRAIPFTLDTTHMAPEVRRVMPEQIVIAALLLASFIAPVWRLFG